MSLKNTKQVICEKCWGTGHVRGGDENSTRIKTCEDCHGIGFIRVPKTNADRIRAMDDELLATQLTQVFYEGVKAIADVELPDELLDEARSQILEKLKQPAEGD